jgi:glycine/D-amino acid oxidase-like deaminating enzyme
MAAPVILPQRAVPVAYEADVVVGAGPGGFAAALQAARMGARVVVVERCNMPGGVHTSGLQGSAGAGVGGIHNVLLTGASLSFSYQSIFMVMRNFPWCTQTGEIAGFAAARCLQEKIKPKELEFATPYF